MIVRILIGAGLADRLSGDLATSSRTGAGVSELRTGVVRLLRERGEAP